MDSIPLFQDNAAKAAAPAARLSADQQLQAFMSSVNAEPLPETLEALQRIPEPVRPVVELLAAEMYQEQFRKLAGQVVSERAAKDQSASARVDPARTPAMLAHSAKLGVLSAVGHLASHPWHVADDKTLRAIASDLERSGEFVYAYRHLVALRPVNLFVAAAAQDDRESYLKAAAAAVKRRRVCNLVLDAELIEWRPEAEFLAACEQLGLRPKFVGISERPKVGQHQMLFPIGRADPLVTVLIDTAGRELALDEHGGVQVPAAPQAPQTAPKAATPAPQGQPVPPSAGVQSKIAALREQQRRRATSRP